MTGGRLLGRTVIALLFVLQAVYGVAGSGSFNGPDGCWATWDDSVLRVGNSLFSRVWRTDGKILRTESFALSNVADPLISDPSWGGTASNLSVVCCTDHQSPVCEPSLLVTATVAGRGMSIRLFGKVPGVVISQDWKEDVLPAPSPREFECANQDAWELMSTATSRMDCLLFTAPNLRVTSYQFNDQTDVHDTLMEARTLYGRTVERPCRHFCSMMDAYDPIGRLGCVLLRIAPQPISRPTNIPDFLTDANQVPIRLVSVPNGYPVAELVYKGEPEEYIAALQSFQRAIRPYRAGRDGVFLSNTWGGGNGDSRINESFLEKEIVAGAELGIDVIQIDDGWQQGKTANSKCLPNGDKGVWNGYWAADPDFWKPDAIRFPNGHMTLVGKAKRLGMRFGLWFGPDSSDNAVNWERDANCLLDYYHQFGIAYFKIDSLKLHSELGFARCRRMFDKMLEKSNGEMVFDLDATAEVRPGYFGLMDIGPIFVENRYARSNYRPWATLASLWQLSHGVDPLRLRIEVVDPDPIREGIDVLDPLAAIHWPLDAGFAIAMFASPLAWMELSEIRPERMAAMKALVATWKRERDNLYAGVTFPVGSRPDGFAWTGFLNRSIGDNGGYALLFRELNAADGYTLDLSGLGLRVSACEILAGGGSASIADNRLSVCVPNKLGYIWVKFLKGNKKEQSK